MAAYPLASETAFRTALTALDPDVSGSSQTLWRAAERDLLHACPSLSLDEFVALRDKLWFERSLGAQPLTKYLRHVTNQFLRRDGSLAVPSLDNDEFEQSSETHEARARSAWRWLSLALPPDILFASLGDGYGCPTHVDTVSTILARRLRDNGFAEVHLHLKAALDFPSLWASTLRVIADATFRSDTFESPGACLDDGRELAAWLLRTAIARYLLAAYLVQPSWHNNLEDFTRNVHSKLVNLLGATSMAVLASALDDLIQGKLSSRPDQLHAQLQLIYAQLTSIRTAQLPQRFEDIQKLDPIASLAGGGGATPEAWFVWQGLTYAERRPKDTMFQVLFWQVLRLRCLLYRHMTQRPMTPGLQWFVRFYSRMSPARKALGTRVLVESAWHLNGLDQGLRSLEVRASPDRSVSDTLSLIRDAMSAFGKHGLLKPPPVVPDDASTEFGFVLHFQRERGGGAEKGCPTAFWRGSNADPSAYPNAPKRGNPSGYRYARFYMERREEAYALGRVLAAFPLTLEHIRGLDLCTDEVGVPTWVMVPLLRYVRDAGEQSSRLLKRQHGISVPPLRTAVHAGEDFVHLMSGLRRLDEAIDRLDLRAGDRIGHGLALGVEPKTWAARAGRIVMPAEERLFDLVWEWSWRSRNGDMLSSHRHLLLDREIAERSEYIFREPVSPREMERLVDDLHDEEVLRWAGFPAGPVPTMSRARSKRFWLLLCVLTDRGVFERGREIIWIDPTGDGTALEELQRVLRRKVGARSITIEVNPSSNLLIAQLAHFGEHPLWRLRPHRATDDVPPLTIAIGSDDPLTFANNLRQDHQLVYDALILDGCSAEQAEAWIEGVRKASLNARFTVPRSGRAVTDIVNAPGFQLNPLP